MAIKLQNRISLIIQLLKPFIFDHRAVLLPGFADVDAAWWWGPLISHISPLLSLFSSPSPLSFFCLHHRQPPASEPPSVVQPPCAASPPVGTRRTPQCAPSPSAGTRRTCIGDGGNGHGLAGVGELRRRHSGQRLAHELPKQLLRRLGPRTRAKKGSA